MKLVVMISALVLLAGCATPPSDADCKTWKEICAERHQKRHSGSCQNYRNLCEL